MTLPILKITNGTTEVDLIQRGGNAFYLNAWRPAIAQLKGGGTWQQSSLSDGRRLVQAQWQNVVETFDLKIADLDPDAIIRETQTLRRLLNEAIEFSTVSWKTDPVWLEARASNETNTRYALIHSWSTPDDDNPFSQPFLQPAGVRMMDRFTLTLERGHWLATAPGTETCVQIAGQGTTNLTETSVNYSVSQSSDDAEYQDGDVGFSLINISLIIGRGAFYPYHVGLRFQNVLVPQGATIITAFVRFECSGASGGANFKVLITGQDADDTVTYSTLLDMITRPKTAESVSWPNDGSPSEPDWILGNFYDTPDIMAIIQEIVDRDGWGSGNSIALFLDDNGSQVNTNRLAAAWDHGTRAEPELHITYLATDATTGRAATCDKEVYVSNKKNMAGLSHIYVDDGGVIGGNEVVNPAFNLLPAVPVANDAIYFGVDTSLTNSGPFSSLAFDIDQVAVQTTYNWQYYDSVIPSWVDIPNLIDRTSPSYHQSTALQIAGVNGVFWQPPSTWVAVDLNSDLGYGPVVTAWWVRCIVTVAGGGAVGPTQQNRPIYTVTWNSVSVDDAQIGGDISALARHLLEDQAGDTVTDLLPYTSRVICGIRSISRGENFTSILNCAPEQVGTQNPSGTLVYHSFDTADQAMIDCATGTAARYTPPGAPDTMASRVIFFFDLSVGLEYLGEFHAYVRAEQNGGAAGDFEVQLTINVGFLEHAIETDIVPTYITGEWMLLDMGRVTIPATAELLQGEVFTISITIEASSTNAAATLDFYDLVLIPTDEWAGDFIDPDKATSRASSALIPHKLRVELDSVINQKARTRAVVEVVASEQVTSVWSTITNGPITLVQNEDQRLHFLLCYYTDAGVLISEPLIWDAVQSFKNQRYLSARGDR